MNQNPINLKSESSHSARVGHLSEVAVGSDFLLGDTMGKFKHGLWNHPLYRVWIGMKERCYNKNNKRHKDYGSRGVIVCKEWKNNPKAFIEWALSHGWKKGLCIDREDNDEDYKPLNCRFVNRALSNRNKQLLQSNNTSGYRGVSFNKKINKYISFTRINGKNKNLGCFKDPIKAAIAYDSMAISLDDGRPTNFG